LDSLTVTGIFHKTVLRSADISVDGLFGCTSLAVLTYIGFDAISTLSEEAENPKRNILVATVMSCLIIGILRQLKSTSHNWFGPGRRIPGRGHGVSIRDGNCRAENGAVGHTYLKPLAVIVGATLLVANFGSGMGAQIGAARLLYGMGRSNALPKSFFGAVDAKHHVPRNNVIFIGVIVLVVHFS